MLQEHLDPGRLPHPYVFFIINRYYSGATVAVLSGRSLVAIAAPGKASISWPPHEGDYLKPKHEPFGVTDT
jgi:hypothetical protein